MTDAGYRANLDAAEAGDEETGMTLDEILKNETPAKVEVVNAPEVPEAKAEADEPKEQRARDEAGKFVSKGEDKVEPKAKAEPAKAADAPAKVEAKSTEKPKAEPAKAEGATPAPKQEPGDGEPADVRGLKAALVAERTKRQQHETQLQAMQQQLAQMNQRPPQPPPDPLQDPNGFQQHMAVQVQQMEQRIRAQAMNQHLNMSEAMARQAHPDLDDVFAIFQEEATNNPSLAAQAYQQQHPWEWVYQQGKRLQLMREIGTDPDAWRNSERERIKAELMQQMPAAPVIEQRQPPPSPPPSLASVGGATMREATSWSGPRSLNQILKR